MSMQYVAKLMTKTDTVYGQGVTERAAVEDAKRRMLNEMTLVVYKEYSLNEDQVVFDGTMRKWRLSNRE